MNKQPDPGFGLTQADLEGILKECLKPEEIAGAPEKQHERVQELIRWFARLSRGHANPKWLKAHAFELVYYIATTDPSRHLDLNTIKFKAFLDGVDLPDRQRDLIRGTPDANETT